MFAAIIAFATIFTFSTWLTVRKPVLAIALVVFLTPWVALTATLGVDLRFYQIATIPLVLRYMIGTDLRRTKPEPVVSLLLLLFIIVSVFATVIKLPFLPETVIEGGFGRQAVPRSLLQIPMLLLTLLPIWLLPRYIKHWEDVVLIIKTLILSLTTLALISMVQLVIWLITGVDPLPVGVINQYLGGNPEDVRYGGEYISSSITLYRVNSFGGEPKGLGSSMAMGMLLIQALLIYVRDKRTTQYLNLCWVLFAVTLFATLSTTALVLWPLGSLVLHGFLGLRQSFPMLKRMGVVIVFILAILIMLPDVPIVEVFSDRTFARFESSETGYMEDFNDAIIGFLQANPAYIAFGTGLGNVHLFANPYLHPVVAEYAFGTAFVAKSAWLRMLSETGIFSLFLFLAWLRALAVSVRKRCYRAGHVRLGNIAKAFLITYGFSYLLVGGYVVGIFMLAAGLGLALSTFMTGSEMVSSQSPRG